MRDLKKVSKAVFLSLLFIVFAYVSFNYFVFGRIELAGFITSPISFEESDAVKIVDREYIVENQKIEATEPNGVGAISNTYFLSIEEIGQNIETVSIDLDSSKENVTGKKISVYVDDEVFVYSEDDAFFSDKEGILWLIGRDNIEKIEISVSYDQYGGSELKNRELITISEIGINRSEDFFNVKRELFYDALRALMFTIIIAAIAVVLCKTKTDSYLNKIKISSEKIFLIVALVAGILFSLLFPVFQIPDELTHINIIYDELNWDMKFQEVCGDFADTSRITRNYDQKVNLAEYFSMEKTLIPPEAFSVPSIKSIRHLPQIMGFIICSLFKAPAVISVIVCEILAAVFYALICYKALKLMPIKKDLLAVVMLLPICLQQMGSFSYDVMLLSMCYLLVAYILNLKFEKEKVALIDLFSILLITFTIVITKMPYALIFGIVVLIPIRKLDLNFGFFRLKGEFIISHKYIFMALCAVLAIPTIYIVYRFLSSDVNGRVLLAAIGTPKNAYELLCTTLKNDASVLATQLTGSFGWFDTPVAVAFTAFVLVNMLFVCFFDSGERMLGGVECKYHFNLIEKVYIFALTLALTAFLYLSMFGWTLEATGIKNIEDLNHAELMHYIRIIPTIGGLQGRYFVPIIPMLALIVSGKRITSLINRINKKTYIILYFTILFIYMTIVLLNRYWIA